MTQHVDRLAVEADQPRSQATAACQQLKRDLMEGVRPPGSKLKINDIAEELRVSPGAVREALSRLVPEGLVVFRDQRGFVVAPLSVEDLEDLTQLRCSIEQLALQLSMHKAGPEWEASVLSTAHHLRRTPKLAVDGRPNPIWRTRHEHFHFALVSACASPRLLAFRAQLHEQSERYRLLSAFIDDDRDVDAEHQALVDAAVDRNLDELVHRITAHFQKTSALIKSAFASPRLELVRLGQQKRRDEP